MRIDGRRMSQRRTGVDERRVEVYGLIPGRVVCDGIEKVVVGSKLVVLENVSPETVTGGWVSE